MERLTGLTALILIAVVASGWLPVPGELSFLLPVYLLGLGFILGILFWLLKYPGEEEGANEQKTKPAGRIREELKRWASHFARYRNHRASLLAATAHVLYFSVPSHCDCLSCESVAGRRSEVVCLLFMCSAGDSDHYAANFH